MSDIFLTYEWIWFVGSFFVFTRQFHVCLWISTFKEHVSEVNYKPSSYYNKKAALWRVITLEGADRVYPMKPRISQVTEMPEMSRLRKSALETERFSGAYRSGHFNAYLRSAGTHKKHNPVSRIRLASLSFHCRIIIIVHIFERVLCPGVHVRVCLATRLMLK